MPDILLYRQIAFAVYFMRVRLSNASQRPAGRLKYELSITTWSHIFYDYGKGHVRKWNNMELHWINPDLTFCQWTDAMINKRKPSNECGNKDVSKWRLWCFFFQKLSSSISAVSETHSWSVFMGSDRRLPNDILRGKTFCSGNDNIL